MLNKRFTYTLYYLFVLCCANIATAQNEINISKYSNEFLSIGIGARERAMGGATAASTNNIYASYWNPAGLVRYRGNFQLGIMHEDRYTGIAKNDFFGFVKPFGNNRNAFAISAIRLGIDNIPNTFNLVNFDGSLNYDNVAPFSANDYAFNLSFARKSHNQKFSFGFNTKTIYRNVGSFAKAWGFGLDIGFQYQTKHFLTGLMLRDISTTFNAWTFKFTEEQKRILGITGNTIPLRSTELTLPKATLGMAYRAEGKTFQFLMEANVDFTKDGQRNTGYLANKYVNIEPKAGVEIGIKNVLKLRAGINNIQEKTNDFTLKKEIAFQPSVGAGLKIKAFTVEYALTDMGDKEFLPYSNVFALSIDFNGKKSTKLPDKIDKPEKPKSKKENKVQELPEIILEQID